MKTLKLADLRCVLAFLAVLAAAGRAQLSFAGFSKADKGTSAAQFLKLGAGAGAAGMGEAYSAVCTDAGAVYWNPGALGSLTGVSGTFTHADLFGELAYEYLGYAQSFDKAGAVGLGIQYLSAGKIPETDPGGFATGADMAPAQLSASLAYGRKIGGFGVGAAAKYVRSRLADTASTLTFDAGLLSPALLDKKLRLAFVVQNAGGGLKYGTRTEPLPLNLKLGSAYSLSDKLLLAVDANFPGDNRFYAGAGAEYLSRHPSVSFACRLGYNSRTLGDIDGLSGVSAGLGIMAGGLALDYAFVPFGSLGGAHRVSLAFKFGGKAPPPAPAKKFKKR